MNKSAKAKVIKVWLSSSLDFWIIQSFTAIDGRVATRHIYIYIYIKSGDLLALAGPSVLSQLQSRF